MKNTFICTKCKSADVTRVKAFKETSTGNMIQLNTWATQNGSFDRYVCLSCGYIEHYANLEEKSWQKWIEKKRGEGSLESDFV